MLRGRPGPAVETLPCQVGNPPEEFADGIKSQLQAQPFSQFAKFPVKEIKGQKGDPLPLVLGKPLEDVLKTVDFFVNPQIAAIEFLWGHVFWLINHMGGVVVG